METKNRLVYSINGKTIAGKWCSQPFSYNLRTAIEFFIKKFPRFKGKAIIEKQVGTDVGSHMVAVEATKWEFVFEFANNKEVKDFLQNLS